MILQGTFSPICFHFFLASEVGGIVSVVTGEKLQTQINGATFSRVLQALSDKNEVWSQFHFHSPCQWAIIGSSWGQSVYLKIKKARFQVSSFGPISQGFLVVIQCLAVCLEFVSQPLPSVLMFQASSLPPHLMDFPGGSVVKESACQCRRHRRRGFSQSLVWEDPLEKGMATLSTILAWKIPWTEEPSELQSMGSQRVGRDRAGTLHLLPAEGLFLPAWASGRWGSRLRGEETSGSELGWEWTGSRGPQLRRLPVTLPQVVAVPQCSWHWSHCFQGEPSVWGFEWCGHIVIEPGREESLVWDLVTPWWHGGEGDVGAGLDLQGGCRPDREPPALRPEGISSRAPGQLPA